jgi:hypothetical protein
VYLPGGGEGLGEVVGVADDVEAAPRVEQLRLRRGITDKAINDKKAKPCVEKRGITEKVITDRKATPRVETLRLRRGITERKRGRG